ncbi:MAG: riboflavin biosynthesis protein RibF, partial [Anaerolineaceae bacterium]|nr:riboflavin biosynthesis protein RibF [Anaerolineaceae bacterium]
FSCLLIGYDFRMGANRKGDYHMLEEMGNKMGFCVRAIAPVLYRNQPVSSSRIRTALINGDLATANIMLGRPYTIEGVIIHGDGRGQHIGLPTANLALWEKKLLPANGVYAAFAEVDNVKRPSVVNIGYRPTFYNNSTLQTIETHILNFSDQIYDKNMKIYFTARLRPEEKYNSIRELMGQIHKDIRKTQEILANDTPPQNLSS